MHKTANNIVGTLQDAGFEAYLVGGCVRDLLLKKEPKDYDIATSAKPEEIEKLFKRTWPIGKAFGVILLEQDGHHFEIATFRTEGDYQDGRRPEKVEFSTAEQDALRRDFTINGIFYNPVNDEHHDYVGGRKDLKEGFLRFIGDPDERVNEDFLRLLRAVRFKHRFSLKYEHDTGKALATHASLVTQIAPERILEEMNKIIVHNSRAIAFCDLFELGILQKLFPEVEALANTEQPQDHHSEGDVLTHTFLVLQRMPEGEDTALYWAAFFHDYAKARCKKWNGERWTFPGHDDLADDMVRPILNRLRFPKALAKKILWLLHYKAIFESFYEMKLSKRLHYYDKPWFEDLLKLERADLMGCIAEDPDSHKKAVERLDTIHENWEYAHRAKLLPSHHNELLSGEEIMKIAGINSGPRIGELKKELRDLQMEGEIKSKAEAKAWLENSTHPSASLTEGLSPQLDEAPTFLITWPTYNSRATEFKQPNDAVILSTSERQSIHDLLLQKIQKENYLVLALNVLDDHVHLVISITEEKLTETVRQLKGYSSYYFFKTPKNSGRINRLWARGFNYNQKENKNSLINTLNYVDQNHLKHEIDSIKIESWEKQRIATGA